MIDRKQSRNTAYLFSGGEQLGKVDKVNPFYYDVQMISGYYTLFKPGKIPPMLKLPVGDKLYTLYIEICLDHAEGVVVDSATEQADLHIVTSSSVSRHSQNIFGRYYIHADTVKENMEVSLQDPIVNKEEILFYTAFNDEPASKLKISPKNYSQEVYTLS